MNRFLTNHKITPANENPTTNILDAPGAGGANHLYHITGFNSRTNPSDPWTARHGQPAEHSTILFQNGPVPEVGINGVTEQALVAIVIDRLRSFQAGPFACRENALALTKLEESLHWMHARTLNRMARGVEGKNEK